MAGKGLPAHTRLSITAVHADRKIQRALFSLAQWSHLALGQIAERQRPDRRAHETQYFEPTRLQDSANLAVLSLVQTDFQPRILFAFSQNPCSLHAHKADTRCDPIFH